MVISCGIILYKVNDKEVKFFVAHPGGPFWVNRDGWNFPKGRLEKKDEVWREPEASKIPFLATSTWHQKNFDEEATVLNAAMREFEEETAIPIKALIHTSRQCELKYLGKIKQSTKKYVHAFSVKYQDQWDIDINECYSNMAEIEYPPKSGKIIEIPENDKFCWMSYEELKLKTNPKHLVFYETILKKINY